MESDEHQKLWEEEPRGQWRGMGTWAAAPYRRGHPDPLVGECLVVWDFGHRFIACYSWDHGDFVVSFSIGVRRSPSFPFFLTLFHIRKSEGFMHANFRRLRDGPNIYSASTA